MGFDNDKKVVLGKADKSRKGSIDKAILPLVNLINGDKDYYTTSSCSGRIVLCVLPENYQKNKVRWLLVSHNQVNAGQLKKRLLKFSHEKSTVWLRQESCILHVCCRDFDAACGLLQLFKDRGFKRSGISSAHKKIVLEIMATEHMDAPVMDKGKILVPDAYLKLLVKEANKKLSRTKEKIKNLTLLSAHKLQ